MSKLLELKLKDFGIEIEVTAVNPGPVITRFEVQPAPGIKVSRISNLAKDLARSLAVISVRVVEVIPGKTVIGIEIPNETREVIQLSQVLSTPDFDRASSPLSMALRPRYRRQACHCRPCQDATSTRRRYHRLG